MCILKAEVFTYHMMSSLNAYLCITTNNNYASISDKLNELYLMLYLCIVSYRSLSQRRIRRINLPKIKGNTGISSGWGIAPTIISLPWGFNIPRYGKSGWTAETVSIIPSNVLSAPCYINPRFKINQHLN